MVKGTGIVNALTVDVEDYFHVTAFEPWVARRHWDHYPSRVEANTLGLLKLFGNQGVRATFFILGWVAHRFPKLVRDIAAAGHEIACHGYWHRLIYRQTAMEFRDDLRLARNIIQDATGCRVLAYRAPTWSITRDSLWALDVLAEEGFEWDSSIFPVHHDRYGLPDAERFPHERPVRASTIREFPPSVSRWYNVNVPVAGGGYFRLYPLVFTHRAIQTINRAYRQPFMFYIHPWELDPEQPRIAAPWPARWRHYVGLGRTADKLVELLRNWPFGTMSEAWPDSARTRQMQASP